MVSGPFKNSQNSNMGWFTYDATEDTDEDPTEERHPLHRAGNSPRSGSLILVRLIIPSGSNIRVGTRACLPDLSKAGSLLSKPDPSWEVGFSPECKTVPFASKNIGLMSTYCPTSQFWWGDMVLKTREAASMANSGRCLKRARTQGPHQSPTSPVHLSSWRQHRVS